MAALRLDLGNPANVPFIIGKRCIQEGVNNLQRKALPYDPCAEGEDVGVVVQAGCLGREAVPAKGGADSVDLVRCDGNADSGAADDDAVLIFAARNGLSDSASEVGIIAARLAVSAEVEVFLPPAVQVLHHYLFQGVSAVI